MQVMIEDDRLFIDGRPATYKPSPNVGGRIEPQMIVAHDTACRIGGDGAISWLCNPRSRVSAHVVIPRDGPPVQLVDFDRSAWHAGKSSWRGRDNCNSWSIGIEIESPGLLRRRGDTGVAWNGQTFPIASLVEVDSAAHGGIGLWLPYTASQIAWFEAVTRALLERYRGITDIVGHFEISPRRKVDVGPQFPLRAMRALAAGRTAPDKALVEAIQKRLAGLGYQPGAIDGRVGPATRSAIRYFQEQNRRPITGEVSPSILEALNAADAKGPVTAPREAATAADLRAGSSTMTATTASKRTAEVSTALATVEALASPAPPPAAPSVVDTVAKVGDGLSTAETARGIGARAADLIAWAQTPHGIRFLVIVSVAAAVWYGAHRVEWRRVVDFRRYRFMGGPA